MARQLVTRADWHPTPEQEAYYDALCAEAALRAKAQKSAVDEALVTDNLGLVYHEAQRMARLNGQWVAIDDYVGEGMLGLLQAAARFDPSRGYRFSTYAVPRIRGAIQDYLRRLDPVGRDARNARRRADRASVTVGP